MWDSVEASRYTTALLRRYARAGLLTKDDPALLAEKVVTAVERNARHVRTPRRAIMLNVLSESPRRMTELLLTRVRFASGTSTSPTHIRRSLVKRRVVRGGGGVGVRRST